MASLIALVNSGVRVNQTASASSAPALPASLVTGRLLLCIAWSKNNETHNWTGSGWTKLDQVNSGASFTVSYGACIVTGTEAAPLISWTTAGAGGSQTMQLSGNDPSLTAATAISATRSNNGTTSPHTCNGIVSTRDFSGIVYLDAAALNTTVAQPTGYIEDLDNGAATGASRNVMGHADSQSGIGTTSPNISMAGAVGAWVLWQLEVLTPLYVVRSLETPLTREPFARIVGNGGGVAPSIPAGLKAERGRIGPALRAVMRYGRPSISGEVPGTAAAAVVRYPRVLNISQSVNRASTY